MRRLGVRVWCLSVCGCEREKMWPLQSSQKELFAVHTHTQTNKIDSEHLSRERRLTSSATEKIGRRFGLSFSGSGRKAAQLRWRKIRWQSYILLGKLESGALLCMMKLGVSSSLTSC